MTCTQCRGSGFCFALKRDDGGIDYSYVFTCSCSEGKFRQQKYRKTPVWGNEWSRQGYQLEDSRSVTLSKPVPSETPKQAPEVPAWVQEAPLISDEPPW